MKKVILQALESLLRLLMYSPKPVVLQAVINEIQEKVKTGQKLSWKLITQALDAVVDDNWDTAFLLVSCIAPTKQIHTNFEKARETLDINLDLLGNPAERAVIQKVFAKSQLSSLLTKRNPIKDVITARQEFLQGCCDALTTEIFVPNIRRYFNTVRRGIVLTRIASGEDDNANECFQASMAKVLERFHKVKPTTYGGYLQKTMRNELIERQMESQEARRFLISNDVNEDGEPNFDFPDDRYNPETPSLRSENAKRLSEVVQMILKGIRTASTTILKEKALTKKRARRLYVLFVLASNTLPERKEIAAKLRVSVETIDKDLAYVRAILADIFKSYGLPEAAVENLFVGLSEQVTA